MELLISASLISAFIAGIAALFAPCCITVLLPAYLGSIFKQRATVFLMTFVFFFGLLVLFLPLGVGFAGLGQLFSQYHNTIFIAGGLFLLTLGASILLGKHFSLPFHPRSNVPVQNAGSVFTLGIFSGFATLCCAPVLAGVLALAVLPGSILWGGIYTLAYVLGMVAPLFFLAYFIDMAEAQKKLGIFKKPISYNIGGNTITLRMADVLSGATFLGMGVLILYLAGTNQIAAHSSYQGMVNLYMANLTDKIGLYLGRVPAALWIAALVIALGLIIRKAIVLWKKNEE